MSAASRSTSPKKGEDSSEDVGPKAVVPASRPSRKKRADAQAKAPKVKLERVSLKLAEIEIALLRELRKRAGKDGMKARKADLIRAGLYLLNAMEGDAFRTALAAGRAIDRVMTARKGKKK